MVDWAMGTFMAFLVQGTKLFGFCDGVLVKVWHGFLVVGDLDTIYGG